VIGAGIAGLTAAYSLAENTPDCKNKIHVYEKESLPCMFSSSRNAAIFRTYESDPTLSILVKNSYRQLLKIEKTSGQLMDRRGLLIDPLELDYYEDSFINQYPDLSEIKSNLKQMNFNDGYFFNGIMVKENGVIDIHAYQNFLLKYLSKRGIVFHYNTCIDDIEIQSDKIIRIHDANGFGINLSENDMVVNAAGSWAMDLISKARVKTPPVMTFKRHLFFLRSKTEHQFSNINLPVLWDEKRDVYIRYESNGFLATHCDQRETFAGDYSSDEKEVDRFLKSILSVFPFLKDHHISRYWACLRTFSLDQIPVVGFDPFIKNLFWVAGLGGRGMTISPGLIPEIQKLTLTQGLNHVKQPNPYSPIRFY